MATYLHFILPGFSKKLSKAADTQPQAFRSITQRAPWVTTYLHFILTATDAQPQAFRWITQRAPWVATYLHFTLTGFSKNIKSRRHTTTGILVNYPEGSVGGYLPTFDINWIFKNRQKPRTHKQRHFSELPRGSLGGYLPTFYMN